MILEKQKKELGPERHQKISQVSTNFNSKIDKPIEKGIQFNPLVHKPLQNTSHQVLQGYFLVDPSEYEKVKSAEIESFATNHLRIKTIKEAMKIQENVQRELFGVGNAQDEAKFNKWKSKRKVGRKQENEVRAKLKKDDYIDGADRNKTLDAFKGIFDLTGKYDQEENPDYDIRLSKRWFSRKEELLDHDKYKVVADLKFFGSKVALFMDEDYQFAINAETTQPKECYIKEEKVNQANEELQQVGSPIRLKPIESNYITIEGNKLNMVRPQAANNTPFELPYHDCGALARYIANIGKPMEGTEESVDDISTGTRYFLSGGNGKGRFGYHVATAVTASAHNAITLENYGRNNERDIYRSKVQSKGGVDTEFEKEMAKAWYFSIYGTKRGTTFQDKWAASETIKEIDRDTLNLDQKLKLTKRRVID